jgi:uncharacterized protein (DUF302 family)
MNSTITTPSKHSVAKTIDRLAALAVSKGLTVFARINHGQNAEYDGLELRPTELLIFGHPRGGTPLMQDRQIAGLDLPVRALSWQDENHKVWLSYDPGSVIAERRGLGPLSQGAAEDLDKGTTTLCGLAAGDGIV